MIVWMRKDIFYIRQRELAQNSGYEQKELEQCLAVLKELEPVGIFSSSLAECLEKQLRVKGVEDETLFVLLRNHMQELMNGQIGDFQKASGFYGTGKRIYSFDWDAESKTGDGYSEG